MSTTINKEEIQKFSRLADEWWDVNGKFKPLHMFNPTRIEYITENIKKKFKIEKNKANYLKGLNILDIGCGGGLISEPMSRLGADVTDVLNSGSDIVHFDVMDNHYVPNLTFGPMICQALRGYGVEAPIDVHLMVIPVDRIIPDFAAAGATYISFHPEATEHIDRTLQLIKDEGCKAGLAFNPATPLDYLDHVLDKLDLVLMMSVNPGFANQTFIQSVLPKIKEVRGRINESGYDVRLEVDGGITLDNVRLIKEHGADTFVSGSTIFNAGRESDPNGYDTVIKSFRSQLQKC